MLRDGPLRNLVAYTPEEKLPLIIFYDDERKAHLEPECTGDPMREGVEEEINFQTELCEKCEKTGRILVQIYIREVACIQAEKALKVAKRLEKALEKLDRVVIADKLDAYKIYEKYYLRWRGQIKIVKLLPREEVQVRVEGGSICLMKVSEMTSDEQLRWKFGLLARTDKKYEESKRKLILKAQAVGDAQLREHIESTWMEKWSKMLPKTLRDEDRKSFIKSMTEKISQDNALYLSKATFSYYAGNPAYILEQFYENSDGWVTCPAFVVEMLTDTNEWVRMKNATPQIIETTKALAKDGGKYKKLKKAYEAALKIEAN